MRLISPEHTKQKRPAMLAFFKLNHITRITLTNDVNRQSLLLSKS